MSSLSRLSQPVGHYHNQLVTITTGGFFAQAKVGHYHNWAELRRIFPTGSPTKCHWEISKFLGVPTRRPRDVWVEASCDSDQLWAEVSCASSATGALPALVLLAPLVTQVALLVLLVLLALLVLLVLLTSTSSSRSTSAVEGSSAVPTRVELAVLKQTSQDLGGLEQLWVVLNGSE